jgi:hypothetical protein
MSTARKNYGPYHTSLGVKKRTVEELLKPIQTEMPKVGERAPSLAAIADEAIAFFARVRYPDIYSAYERRDSERRSESQAEGHSATEDASQTEETR